MVYLDSKIFFRETSMYLFVRIVVILICLSGIFYVVQVNKKYQGDSSGREEIVKYFKD